MRIRPIARLIQEALSGFDRLPFAANDADAAFSAQAAVPESALVVVRVEALAVPELALVQELTQVSALALVSALVQGLVAAGAGAGAAGVLDQAFLL